MIGDDIEHLVYFVSNRLVHAIRKNDKSIWKWKYGSLNNEWEKIGDDARSIWQFKNLLRLSNDEEGSLDWWIKEEKELNGEWQKQVIDRFEVLKEGRIKLCREDSCEFIGSKCKQLAVAPLTADEKALWSLNSENGDIWQWEYGASDGPSAWLHVGTGAKGIFCNEDGKVFAIDSKSGEVQSYDNEPFHWTKL